MGKKLPRSLVKKIGKLHEAGLGRRAIAERLGVSVWSVRKWTVPGFAESELQRMRKVDAERGPKPASYEEWRSDYFKTDEYRTKVRERMRQHRARKTHNG